MSCKKPTPAPARPAATIVIARDGIQGPELLMVRRRAGEVFGDSYAFPGGLVDADESSARDFCRGITAEEADTMLQVSEGGLDFYTAAIRELFEETGILLAQDEDGAWADDDPELVVLREAVDKGRLPWSEFLRDRGLRMSCDSLHYFAHWETPLTRPNRWSARFFLAEMPPGQDASHDGGELTDSRWLSAGEALSVRNDGSMKVPFPTRRTLAWLAEIDTLRDLLDWARDRGLSGVTRIRPIELKEPGKPNFVIPGDPDYPPEGEG